MKEFNEKQQVTFLRRRLPVRNELIRLYWKEKKSTTEIAHMFGVTHTAVVKSFRKFGIRTRSMREAQLIARRKWTKIVDIEKLKQMYYEKKLSLAKIAQKLGVGKDTIRNRMITHGLSRRYCSLPKYPRKPFSGNEIEKYYLIGLRTGDLTVSKVGKTICVYLSTTHPAMINLFHKIFRVYGHCNKIPRKTTTNSTSHEFEWENYVGLDETFKFLLKKPSRLPKNDLFYSFLAGYGDADGCWFLRKRGYNNIEIRFSLITKDYSILEEIKNRLEADGYHPKLRPHPDGRKILCLGIFSEVVRLAKKLLPYTQHEEKIAKIKLILKIKKGIPLEKIMEEYKKLSKKINHETKMCVNLAREEYMKKHKLKLINK